MNFLGVGVGELLLILVIAMMVVGPERMVELAGQLGRMLAKFREQSDSITREFKEAFTLELEERAGEADGDGTSQPTTVEASAVAAPGGDGQALEAASEVAEAPGPSPEELAALEAARLERSLAEDMVDGEVEVVLTGLGTEGDGAKGEAEDDTYLDIEPVDLPLAAVVPEDQDVEPTMVNDLLVIPDEDMSAEVPLEGEE